MTSVIPKAGRVSTAFSSRSNRCGGGTSTQRPANRPKKGPATTMVGMATSTPSISVVPRSAPRVSIATSGPGCGGTRPCIADRPARVGMPIVITESCARRATR